MAVRSLYLRCTLELGMDFSYPGPKDAAAELLQAKVSLCVYSRMPHDWPDRGKAVLETSKHYEAAKRLDPNIP